MPEATGDALGILGGTFDPVHSAHLALATAARAKLGLASVLWIPAGQPSHRTPPVAASADRLAMVKIATTGHAAFEVDATETLAATPSYTVPTLERLRARFGQRRPLVLLLGADAFLGLPTWYRWREISTLAHLAVATRPGYPLEPAAMAPELAELYCRTASADFSGLVTSPAGAIYPFELVAGTVSATATRKLLAAGHDPGDWLPPGVLAYIRNHHLYGT